MPPELWVSTTRGGPPASRGYGRAAAISVAFRLQRGALPRLRAGRGVGLAGVARRRRVPRAGQRPADVVTGDDRPRRVAGGSADASPTVSAARHAATSAPTVKTEATRGRWPAPYLRFGDKNEKFTSLLHRGAADLRHRSHGGHWSTCPVHRPTRARPWRCPIGAGWCRAARGTTSRRASRWMRLPPPCP